jgi:putative SOS response-associated peptidase YedK
VIEILTDVSNFSYTTNKKSIESEIMCGRFTLFSSAEAIANGFAVDFSTNLTPSYNIAPSQTVNAIVQMPDQLGRKLHHFRWGLIPSWAKDAAIAHKLINARSETVSEKPSFRSAFKHRRCLIPTDGFYEWQHAEDGKAKKQPYFFSLKDRNLFALAGLWESWESPEGDIIETCTILTTEANDILRPIHDRMPVILNSEYWDMWLDPSFDNKNELQATLKPYPAKEMTARSIGTKVNSPKNNSPECIEAIS